MLLEPKSLLDRVVIVTGGAGTIGRAICHACAAAGAKVVVNDLGSSTSGTGASGGPAEEVAESIRTRGFPAIADTHSVLEADKIVDTALEAFGRVDVVINNAGVVTYERLQDLETENLRHTLEVNTLGPMLLCHRVWPLFLAQNYGRVVNITSALVFGFPLATPYSVSKAGLIGLTKGLAAEAAGYNIRVNAVAPTAPSRMTTGGIKEEERQNFEKEYPLEGNLAIILALILESHDFNGEIFATASYKVNRIVFGVTPGLCNVQSGMAILNEKERLVQEESKVTQLASAPEFLQFLKSNRQAA
jgi:NAD(P)-dependent dehydrogenase (short-subunit alcohol dehydrogenase family)